MFVSVVMSGVRMEVVEGGALLSLDSMVRYGNGYGCGVDVE